MRYINLARLVMPSEWLKRSAAAAEKVAEGADPNDFADVWRELKEEMGKLSHKKCWYCESPADRSDNAVDHFRPKGRVSDAAKPHSGYSWLAFEKSNLRYSCTYCNSRRKGVDGAAGGGKGDRFPLVDETRRVYAKGPTDQEQPMLLDPCDFSDGRLLGCEQENGWPCVTSKDVVDRERVKASIEIYHLRYEPTCKQRHTAAVRLMAHITEGKRLFEPSATNPVHKREFMRIVCELHEMIADGAAFSGEMRFLVRGQRSEDHPWIQDLLEA